MKEDRAQLTLLADASETPQAPAQPNLLPWLRLLLDVYWAGKLGGTTHEVFPDVAKSCRENYLYFTLAPALNFQRASEGLWRSALATYSDETTQFVFFPENVRGGEERYRTALTRHGLALQPVKHTSIWYRLCSTLSERHGGDPRALLEYCDCDVPTIKEYLAENRRLFPYLSGPKLSNYWLYMLLSFTDVDLKHREEISIIPDVHVRKATVRLGLADVRAAEDPMYVAEIWRRVLGGSGLVPIDLHAPLWRWSRAAFPDIARL